MTTFQVSELYSNYQIQESLKVGNAGGIRVSLAKGKTPKRLVILTSSPSARQASENPYADRVEGDTLVYTGGGREGNQSLAGVNKRIPQQLMLDFPIYGFSITRSRRSRRTEPKRWEFIGMLEYVRHYSDTQVDIKGNLRHVWVFEFQIHREPKVIIPQYDQEVVTSLLKESRTSRTSEDDDREIAPTAESDACDVNKLSPMETELERSRLLSLPPRDFEHLVRDLLVVTGFEKVNVTQFSQDGGVDVNAFAGTEMWPIRNQLIQVQAKRWMRTVGRREVAQLRGSLQPFARGAVVTTSHFSKAAIVESTDNGKSPITLIDGHSLASLVWSRRTELASLHSTD